MRKSATTFFAAATLSLVASAFAAPQARAQDVPPFVPTKALEEAVETSTEDVLLPTSVPGTITFRNCAEPCALRSLSVTAQSTFFVGQTPVTLADFSAFLRSGGLKPVTVFRQAKGTNVTRVVVIGEIGPSGQIQPRQSKRAR